MRSSIGFRSSVLAALLFLAASARAQSEFQLPYISEAGASTFLRPSVIPDNRFFVGLPALSGLDISLVNDGLDYLGAHTMTDTGAYLDFNTLLSDLHRRNTLSVSQSIDVLSGGFRFKRWYFDMNFSRKVSMLFRYPREFMDLLYQGNGAFIGTTVDMSMLGMDATHYWEVGVGSKFRINDNWTTGMRIRRVFGIDNVSTDMQTFRANTAVNDYELQLSSDMVVNSSTVFNTPGGFDSVRNEPSGISNYLFGNRNKGWAFDLGVAYAIDEKLTVSLDVTDLGFIKWVANPVNYRIDDGYYSFGGLAVDDYLLATSDSADVLQGYVDSLKASFEVRETADAYSTQLPARLMLSGSYVISEKTVGCLSIRGTRFMNEMIPEVGVLVRHHLGSHFSLSGSLAFQYGNFVSFGTGVVMQFGLFNLYVLTDDLYGTLLPLRGNRSQLSFGMSVSRPTWGSKKSRKAVTRDRY